VGYILNESTIPLGLHLDDPTRFNILNGIVVEYAYYAASRINITYKQNGTTELGDLTYEYDKQEAAARSAAPLRAR
jgi:hypothetical protein